MHTDMATPNHAHRTGGMATCGHPEGDTHRPPTLETHPTCTTTATVTILRRV